MGAEISGAEAGGEVVGAFLLELLWGEMLGSGDGTELIPHGGDLLGGGGADELVGGHAPEGFVFEAGGVGFGGAEEGKGGGVGREEGVERGGLGGIVALLGGDDGGEEGGELLAGADGEVGCAVGDDVGVETAVAVGTERRVGDGAKVEADSKAARGG